MNNLTAFARRGALRLIGLQAVLTGLLALVCDHLVSHWAALSLLMGGGIAIIGTAVMAVSVFWESGAPSAKRIMKNVYRGEALKLLLVAALFGLTFITVVNVVPLALLLGFILAQACYWVAFALFTAK